MDDKLSKELDDLTLNQEMKTKNKLKKKDLIAAFIDDKIIPTLNDYFKKIENMGAKINITTDPHYEIRYKNQIFSISRSRIMINDNDFGLEYSYEGAGVVHGKEFKMETYEETLNNFILEFHKYLLDNS